MRTGELTIAQLMEKMSFNPACLYRLEKGWLTEGEDADLVLFDENEEWTAGDYASKASNCPFTGWKLYGKVNIPSAEEKLYMKIRALLIDIDGTLLDFRQSEALGISAIMEHYGVTPHPRSWRPTTTM